MESDAVLSTSLSQGAFLQVLSRLPQLQQTPPIAKYSYLVKFIQAQKKSDFTVRMWHDADEKFTSLTNLRMNLMDYFHDELPTPSFKLGYYETPHNTKRWLVEQRDLQAMYKSFSVGARITLWCETAVGSTGSDPDCDAPPQKKRTPTPRERAEEELDEVFKQLKEKHPGMESSIISFNVCLDLLALYFVCITCYMHFSTCLCSGMESPKLRLWAKLIHTGRHEDYVTPPNIPLITGKTTHTTKPKSDGMADAVAEAATAIVKAINHPGVPQPQTPPKSCSSANDLHVKKISPLKVVTLRRSCLDDLKRAKELYEEDILTDAEFHDEKQRILDMLKGLSQP